MCLETYQLFYIELNTFFRTDCPDFLKYIFNCRTRHLIRKLMAIQLLHVPSGIHQVHSYHMPLPNSCHLYSSFCFFFLSYMSSSIWLHKIGYIMFFDMISFYTYIHFERIPFFHCNKYIPKLLPINATELLYGKYEY